MQPDKESNTPSLTGSQEKADFCKSLGAGHAINYKTQDFAEQVKSITGISDMHMTSGTSVAVSE
jgi:NADPH:quinone reductase-like Zn-dependent oxidoreductase